MSWAVGGRQRVGSVKLCSPTSLQWSGGPPLKIRQTPISLILPLLKLKYPSTNAQGRKEKTPYVGELNSLQSQINGLETILCETVTVVRKKYYGFKKKHQCTIREVLQTKKTKQHKSNTSLLMLTLLILTLPRVKRHWEIHPPRTLRFPSGRDFEPLGPREISRSSGDVFLSTSFDTPTYSQYKILHIMVKP